VRELFISTPLGEEVEIEDVYEGFIILIKDYKLRVDLIALNMLDFDIILEIGCLSMYLTKMDCYAKIIILRMSNGGEVEFTGGERNVVFNRLISMMTTRKLIIKWCEVFLAYLKDVQNRGKKFKKSSNTRIS
jgi:hypothetical protein